MYPGREILIEVRQKLCWYFIYKEIYLEHLCKFI